MGCLCQQGLCFRAGYIELSTHEMLGCQPFCFRVIPGMNEICKYDCDDMLGYSSMTVIICSYDCDDMLGANCYIHE